MGVIRAVLNSFFFLRKYFAHTKSTKKHKKHKKAENATSKQQGYGGPTKPVIVLPYIQTKTSLLGPFRKLNCLDDLIYITTKSHVQSQQKSMSKND